MSDQHSTLKVRVRVDAKCEYFAFDTKTSTDRWSAEKHIQRIMGYNNNGHLNYPIVPGFLNLARLTAIDESDIFVDEPRKVVSFIETPQEKIEETIRQAISETQMSSEVMRKVKSRLDRNDDLSFDDEFDGLDEASMNEYNTTLQLLDIELRTMIAEAAEKLAKKHAGLKLKKRVRKTEHIKKNEPCIAFEAEVSEHELLRLEFVGSDAAFIRLLLPAIRIQMDKRIKLKQWRMFGVPQDERDYVVTGKFQPFEHQWVMYKTHMLLGRSADLSQMGVAKTYPVLMAIVQRLKSGEVKKGRVLVICPANTMPNWEKEIKLHTPQLTSRILSGSYADRLNALINEDRPDIFIVNYEVGTMKFAMDRGNGTKVEVPLTKLMTLINWDMIVLDEAHRIKNPDAKRTGAIIAAFGNVKYATIMSGTINANKVHDVHMPFVFLNRARNFNPINYDYRQQLVEYHHVTGVDENGNKVVETKEGTGQKMLEPSTLHEHFLNNYFTKDGYNYVPKHFTVKDLRAKMEEISVRFEKSECMSLPAKMYEMRLVDMHSDQARLYAQLKATLTADLEEMIGRGGRVTMMSVLALMTKLAEAANGWLYDKQHNVLNFPWNPKLDALLDIIEDIDDNEKVVVWSRFTADLHSIADKLKAEYGPESVRILHGGVSCSTCGMRGSERFESTVAFNDMNSKVRFMIANPAAGGEGIDLVGASYEIYFSNSFNKIHRMQSEDRCHRPGMREKLTIVDLVMKRTIDEETYSALRSWKSMAASLLEHLGVDKNKMEKLLGPGDFTMSNEPPVISDHTTVMNDREGNGSNVVDFPVPQE